MTAVKKKAPRTGQGIGGGRPPLAPGQTREIVSLSMSTRHRDKLVRISGGKPSEFVRNLIDTYPDK